MKEWLLNQGIFTYIYAVILAMGVIGTLVANRGYKRLLKEVDKMTASNHKLIKHIKMKFESYHKLGIQPQNSLALTKVFMYKYKIGPLSLHNWGKMNTLAIIAGCLVAVLGTGLYIYEGKGIQESILLAMSGGAISLLLAIQAIAYGLKQKKYAVEASILDYLDNFMKSKFKTERNASRNKSRESVPERRYKELAATNAENIEKEPRNIEKRLKFDQAVDARVVEDVLREFLK